MARARAHIPASVKDPVMQMSCVDPVVGDVPTIFVGIVDKNYTDNMWKCISHRLAKLFGISDHNLCCHIKVGSLNPELNLDIIDAERLQEQTTKAVTMINQKSLNQKSKENMIRIVLLGSTSSPAITDALEALIRGWEVPSDEKNMQFIALGESENYHYLNFCKSLCMKMVYKSLQYYNTMDYNSFGYLRHQNSLLDMLQSQFHQHHHQ